MLVSDNKNIKRANMQMFSMFKFTIFVQYVSIC